MFVERGSTTNYTMTRANQSMLRYALGLQLPSFAIGRVEIDIRRVIVCEAKSLLIPLERLAGETDCDRSQQGNLCQPSAIVEVGSGWAAVLDGIEPVPVMVLDACDLLLRRILARV